MKRLVKLKIHKHNFATAQMNFFFFILFLGMLGLKSLTSYTTKYRLEYWTIKPMAANEIYLIIIRIRKKKQKGTFLL